MTLFTPAAAVGASAHNPANAIGWMMYGHDASGDRNSSAESVLTPARVPDVRERWRFRSLGGPIYGTPAVDAGVVYDADVSGNVFALNARKGVLEWVVHPATPGPFPLAITSSPLLTGADVVIGDQKGFVWALNRNTGHLHWVQRPNSTARGWPAIWGSPTLATVRTGAGRRQLILVPVASNEETFTPTTQQPCCYARGSVAALDPDTGAVVWQTYTISERQRAAGAAGASVWTAPAYDARHNLVIVNTGNNFATTTTAPTTTTSDAFLALDAATGQVRWQRQCTARDTYVTGVKQGPGHPDYDFGDSPEIFTVGGRDVVAAGQKNGFMWLLDVATGRVLDHRRFLPPGELGGFFADSAEANDTIFADGNNWPGYGGGEVGGLGGLILGALQSSTPPNAGELVAIKVEATGQLSQLWRFVIPHKAILGATAVASSVVWVHASQQGTLYALNARSGQILAHLPIGPAVSGPAISNGAVYLAYGDTMGFAAHDPTTGGILSVGISRRGSHQPG